MEVKSTAKKSILNILSSVFNQVFAIALGLIIPRLYLVTYGSEVNGLLNSIGQVFSYLALLEAGVGTATLTSLYKPVAQNDKNSISSIMSATHIFYKRTGIIYFIAVLLLSVGYPLIVKSDLPMWEIVLIIQLNGLPNVISFFYQGKYNILMQSEGKNYILTNLSTIITFLTNISKVVLMLIGLDVISIQIAYFIFNLIKMAFIMIYVKKHYKWLDVKTKPNFQAISQKNSVLVMQLCDMVFRHTDVIILTIFCDLKVVSVYTIYNTLFSTISTFMDAFSQGFSFALGQKFDTNRKRYIKLHDIYETYRMALVFSLIAIAYIFIIPFIKLYTSGVTDINYVDKYIPFLFTLNLLLTNGRANSSAVITYAKHFKQTQWRCVAEAIINLTVSLVAVNFFGIYGVLLGTFAALLYRANDMIIYANKKILLRSPWVTYKRWLVLIITFVLVEYAVSYINVDLSSYLKIILWAVVACATIIPIFFGVISLIEYRQTREAYTIIKKYILGFLSKYKSLLTSNK